MEYDWERLADYIRAEMARRHWSREQLAEEAGIGGRTINRLVSGKPHSRMPTALPRLEVAFGWDPGTTRRILEGGTPARENDQPADDDDDAWIDEVLARIESLPETEQLEALARINAEILRHRRHQE